MHSHPTAVRNYHNNSSTIKQFPYMPYCPYSFTRPSLQEGISAAIGHADRVIMSCNCPFCSVYTDVTILPRMT